MTGFNSQYKRHAVVVLSDNRNASFLKFTGWLFRNLQQCGGQVQQICHCLVRASTSVLSMKAWSTFMFFPPRRHLLRGSDCANDDKNKKTHQVKSHLSWQLKLMYQCHLSVGVRGHMGFYFISLWSQSWKLTWCHSVQLRMLLSQVAPPGLLSCCCRPSSPMFLNKDNKWLCLGCIFWVHQN